jgi:hypothetical protein
MRNQLPVPIPLKITSLPLPSYINLLLACKNPWAYKPEKVFNAKQVIIIIYISLFMLNFSIKVNIYGQLTAGNSAKILK